MKANKSKNTRQPRESGRFNHWFGPVIVGLIMLMGQSIVSPIVAKEVKRKESILEQKYAACNDAFGILVRKLERISVTPTGGETYKPAPTKENITAVEFNLVYCRLALFCSNSSVPNGLVELWNAKPFEIEGIGEFVQKVREEMGIKGEGVLPNDFNFAYHKKKIEALEKQGGE